MRKVCVKETSSEMFVADRGMSEVTEYCDKSLFRKRKECTDPAWVGADFKTWEDVQQKTHEAWEFGMMAMKDAVDRLRNETLPELKNHTRKFIWTYDDGDEIDLDRMRDGLPFWKKYVREATHGPTEVTIITDTTTPFTKDSDDIIWRGAVAVALACILEEKGYRVELWVVNGSHLYGDSPSTPVCTAACLKRTSDPLDSSTLINTVSGWFYRSATFNLLNTICNKEQHKINYGYGTCYTPRPADLDELSRDALRIYSSGVFTYNGAFNMILEEVKKIAAAQEGT